MSTGPVRAVVWDFDNTLVDTRAKNLSVTRRIIESVTDRSPDEFAPLRSLAAYDEVIHHTQNWQTLYTVEFGLEPEQVEVTGVVSVVRALEHLPQAIVSMNTRGNIREGLQAADLIGAFELVIGCEEVQYNRQKPAPDGLLHCMEEFDAVDAATVIYVGDHPVDAECAANANAVLSERGATARVLAIGAMYGTAVPDGPWPIAPDYVADTPHDVLKVIGSLAETIEPA
jgi:HAD superfamily hydrolase (TIGR01549 family)